MNYRECAKLLRAQDRVLLLTHRDPDGDTVGSAAALCSALRRLGKTAWLYPNPGFTRRFTPYLEDLVAPDDFAPDCCVTVDLADEKLFPGDWSGEVLLCVDHHGSNSHYAQNELVRPEKSACGEIVLELIKSLCGDVTEREATLLYIAVTTDTGCFQYANTNMQTFAAASELLRLGAKQHEVSQVFFRKVSPARLKLEGLIYSTLRFFDEGRIAAAVITQDMLRQSGAKKEDLDDLASLSGRAEGSILNLTIREQPDGTSRVSVRSNPGVDSCAICAAFGGGGHTMAAGCNIACPPEKALALLLDVIGALGT